MFSKEDFLLPSGEPMSALEIADMLNSWADAPRKGSLPNCIKNTGITNSYTIPKRDSFSIQTATDGSITSVFHVITKPLYTGVDDYIHYTANKAYVNNLKHPIRVGLTLDLLLSLEHKINTAYSYLDPYNHQWPTQNLTVMNTVFGPVEIFLIEGETNVEVFYHTADRGLVK